MRPLAEADGLRPDMMELAWKGRTVCFVALGDGAVTVRVGDKADPEVNTRVRMFVDAAAAVGFPGFVEAAAGYHTATVYYDAYELYRGLDRLEADWPGLAEAEHESLQGLVCEVLARIWAGLKDEADEASRLIHLPVLYGGEWGPDLEEAASLCGLEPEDFVRMHSGAEYRVYMVGFVPGFPYLGGLPERLAVPRRSTPRLKVPPGSVAIGGGQTGIYPFEVPGGWHLIGRTPLELFRPDRDEPCLLMAEDRVRFVPVEEGEWREGGFGPWG